MVAPNIVTAAEMRALERAADAAGLGYPQMMHNAGRAAAAEIMRRWAGAAPRVVVLAGSGSNGGDGLVCAVELARISPAAGVSVYLLRPRLDDPLVASAARLVAGDLASDDSGKRLQTLLDQADIVVDALLGTGIARPLDAPIRTMLGALAARRAAPRPPIVYALDGPTGMQYDTGGIDPATVPADVTLTFHAAKRGHYCYPAAGARGQLVVLPIGIDALAGVAPARGAQVRLATEVAIRGLLPVRGAAANKGSHGRVVIHGGSPNYPGAPALAAAAAYRSGAGLVTLVVPDAIRAMAAGMCPEATHATLSDTDQLDRAEAVLIGPGMGMSSHARAALERVLDTLSANLNAKACVLDADGLNLLAPLGPADAGPPRIVTPHPGEMGRLAGIATQAVQADRIGIALSAASAWKCVVVLKGAHTVVAAPSGDAWVLPFANPALAVAGTGDVLAGCIAGLAGQGCQPFAAAVCGAFVHGAAGERWREAHGDAGLLASDLLGLLPDVLRDLRAAAWVELASM